MTTDDRRDRLRSLTADAARRSRAAREDASHPPGRGGPAPGTLYALAATADPPVEWALLERQEEPDRADSTSWLAVPADTNPLVGGGDVWIPAGEPSGPLCLRCRFGTPVPDRLLDRGHATGAIPEEARLRALDAWRRHERGELEPGPLAEEAEADPEYEDWEDDVLRPAVAALTEAAAAAPAPPPRARAFRVSTFLAAAAAVLAVVAVGLGGRVLQLREEVELLSEPIVLGSTHEVSADPDARGPVTLHARPGAQRLLLFVILSPEQTGHERYRLELAAPAGTEGPAGPVLWSGSAVALGPIPELNLILPRALLDRPDGLRLRVYGIDGADERLLADVPLRLGEGAG
ncbi:MAG: hypothetical protein PVG07_03375 [Acidobacteriota bacterium]